MSQRGFFLMFPDDDSLAYLKKQFPNAPEDVHLTLLVIDDEKEIRKFCGTNGVTVVAPLEVKILNKGMLQKRDGTHIDVLFVEKEPCLHLKKHLIQQYELFSDVYGSSQEFHITLGLCNKNKTPQDVEVAVKLRSLRFNKCMFSPGESDMNVRQAAYLNRLSKNIHKVVPDDKKTRWCLIFGQKVLADFQTEAEARAYKAVHNYLHLTLYAPK